MSEQDEKNINHEKDVILNDAKVKKSRWKLHVVLSTLLACGLWLFWTFAPLALQFKQYYFADSLLQSVASTEQQEPQVTGNMPQASKMANTPTFAPMPELPILAVPSLPAQQRLADNSAYTRQSLKQIQQQIAQLNEQLSKLQHQQIQYRQMQVRVQLFAALVQASSPKSTLNEMILAWKGISFMPLLSADKRAFAIEALHALQQTQAAVIAEEEEAVLLIQALTQQLEPYAQQPHNPTTADTTTTDPYQVVTQQSWLGWLSDQFHVSKVKPQAAKAQDPDAPIKRMIDLLQQYQQQLHNEQWQSFAQLPLLIYQLEQRGIMTELSIERAKQTQTTLQTWQNQALLWMEAL